MTEEPTEIDIPTAARAMGDTVAYVRELVADGTVSSREVDGTVLIPVAELREFAERRAGTERNLRRMARLVGDRPEDWDH